MKIRAFRKFGDLHPIIADVAVVVVEADDGSPLSVACDVGNGTICASVVGNDDFDRILQTLGFNKMTIVENLDSVLKKPEDLPVLIGE